MSIIPKNWVFLVWVLGRYPYQYPIKKVDTDVWSRSASVFFYHKQNGYEMAYFRYFWQNRYNPTKTLRAVNFLFLLTFRKLLSCFWEVDIFWNFLLSVFPKETLYPIICWKTKKIYIPIDFYGQKKSKENIFIFLSKVL